MAQLRGLEDPFKPAEVILASVAHIRELQALFGSPGLAAVARNAGEVRTARFRARQPYLPVQTQAYMLAFTGYPAETWLDHPSPEPVLALDPAVSFREACHARAEDWVSNGPKPASLSLQPWGVILAAQGSLEATERQVSRPVDRHDDALSAEYIVHIQARLPGMAQLRHVAQVDRDSREEAKQLSADLRAEACAT